MQTLGIKICSSFQCLPKKILHRVKKLTLLGPDRVLWGTLRTAADLNATVIFASPQHVIVNSGTITVSGTVATNADGSVSGGTEASSCLLMGGVYHSSFGPISDGQQAAIRITQNGYLQIAGAPGNTVPTQDAADFGSSGGVGSLAINVGWWNSNSGTFMSTASGNAFPVALHLNGINGLASGQATMANSLPVVIASDQSAVPVSGTITANQGGTWTVQQGSAPWSQNLTQVNSVALGSPSVYGTSPGAVNVIGVNSFITNVPAVSQSGTWNIGTVTSITNPVTVVGDAAAGSSAAGNPVLIAGADSTGKVRTLSVDSLGEVYIANFPTTIGVTEVGNWTVSISGSVNQGLPNSNANAWPMQVIGGANDVLFIQANAGWVRGTLTNNNAAPNFNNIGVLPALANAANPSWTEGDQVLLSVDLSGHQRVNVANTVTVTGTVTANQGTNPWVVSLASTTITGTVAVTQSTNPWIVQDTAAEASLSTLASCVETAGSPPVPIMRVTLVPAASEGYSTEVEQALTTSVLVKSSPGKFTGFDWGNPNPNVVYIFVYDTTSAPAIGSKTNLVYQKMLPANAGSHLEIAGGVRCSSGIYVAVSTSPSGTGSPPTPPAIGVVLTTMYE